MILSDYSFEHLCSHTHINWLRQIWQKVVAQGKLALDQEHLVESAAARLAALGKLAGFVKESSSDFPEISAEAATACGNGVPGLIAELKSLAGTSQDAGKMASDLETSMKELAEMLDPRMEKLFAQLTEWISTLWATDSPVGVGPLPDGKELQFPWESTLDPLGRLSLYGAVILPLPKDQFDMLLF